MSPRSGIALSRTVVCSATLPGGSGLPLSGDPRRAAARTGAEPRSRRSSLSSSLCQGRARGGHRRRAGARSQPGEPAPLACPPRGRRSRGTRRSTTRPAPGAAAGMGRAGCDRRPSPDVLELEASGRRVGLARTADARTTGLRLSLGRDPACWTWRYGSWNLRRAQSALRTSPRSESSVRLIRSKARDRRPRGARGSGETTDRCASCRGGKGSARGRRERIRVVDIPIQSQVTDFLDSSPVVSTKSTDFCPQFYRVRCPVANVVR